MSHRPKTTFQYIFLWLFSYVGVFYFYLIMITLNRTFYMLLFFRKIHLCNKYWNVCNVLVPVLETSDE